MRQAVTQGQLFDRRPLAGSQFRALELRAAHRIDGFFFPAVGLAVTAGRTAFPARLAGWLSWTRRTVGPLTTGRALAALRPLPRFARRAVLRLPRGTGARRARAGRRTTEQGVTLARADRAGGCGPRSARSAARAPSPGPPAPASACAHPAPGHGATGPACPASHRPSP